eukprot:3058928-Prymnesium_polylepis.1
MLKRADATEPIFFPAVNVRKMERQLVENVTTAFVPSSIPGVPPWSRHRLTMLLTRWAVWSFNCAPRSGCGASSVTGGTTPPSGRPTRACSRACSASRSTSSDAQSSRPGSRQFIRSTPMDWPAATSRTCTSCSRPGVVGCGAL